ncbi:MAG: winged helix-turn-helix domain-containing protein [Elusimicrobia bacterium]|nr:winged helix-turn-helix domain-containing protein [Elusimicrobiota bacterium]
MDEIIGLTAGSIWNYINENGETSAIKLKASLGISNRLLCFSLGWLSREQKVLITEDGLTFKVSLR